MKRTLTIWLGAVSIAALTAGGAAGADLSTPMFEPVAAPVAEDWTSFFVGLHVGYGRGTTDYVGKEGEDEDGEPSNLPLHIDHDLGGWLGGAQIGYDHQIGSNVVVGIVGDFSFTDIDGDPEQLGPPAHFETEIDWMASVRARLGYLVTPDFLTYIHGGIAWADIAHKSKNVPGGGGGPPGPWKDLKEDDVETGWIFGVGAEARLTRRWSFFAEYAAQEFDDIDLKWEAEDEDDGDCEAQCPIFKVENEVFLHTLKIGVNYRF